MYNQCVRVTGFYTNRESLFYRINASVQVKRPERFPTTLTYLTLIREIPISNSGPECAFWLGFRNYRLYLHQVNTRNKSWNGHGRPTIDDTSQDAFCIHKGGLEVLHNGGARSNKREGLLFYPCTHRHTQTYTDTHTNTNKHTHIILEKLLVGHLVRKFLAFYGPFVVWFILPSCQ
jgi:hypothetical protein